MSKTRPPNPAAVALGRRGGNARAAHLDDADRHAAAKRASDARWASTRLSEADVERAMKDLRTRLVAATREGRIVRIRSSADSLTTTITVR